MKKYELTGESIESNILNTKLYRIKALKDFGDVKAGDRGGFIAKEDNLSHEGNAWVYDNAKVYDDARVCGDAIVCNNARVGYNAIVGDNAKVYDDAEVYGDARVGDNAKVYDDAEVYGDASVSGNAWVYDNAKVYDGASVYDDASVCGDARVCGNARVCGDAEITENTHYATISGFGTKYRTTTFFVNKSKDVKVVCGCFYGTLNEFRELVKQNRTGKIAKEYLLIADLMEQHFSDNEGEE